MNKDKALKLLTKEVGEGYEQPALSMILKYEESLVEAFWQYVDTEELPNFEYKGITLKLVKEKTHRTDLGSIMVMHRIMQDDNLAEIFPNMTFGIM